MTWIKRNLLFVIGAVVSLGLLGFAGYYNFTGWKHNQTEAESRKKKYADLKYLYGLNPHPGDKKVDNIKLARQQQKEVEKVLAEAMKHFQSPPAIPASPTVASGEFAAALRRTVDEMTRKASAASVMLPPDYKFSFYQQFRLLTFAPGSLESLARQLGEIKAICDLLIQAKVNSIDAIQRELVSTDDAAGPQTDYLIGHASRTNDFGTGQAVITPYQITFRSFSAEIAQVLAGLANSPYGVIVQNITIAPAAGAGTEPGSAPAAPVTYQPAPAYRTRNVAEEDAAERAALRPDLYRMPGRTGPPPGTPTYPPPTAYTYAPPPTYPVAPARAGATGPQWALSEKPLQVTLQLQIVKLLPRK